MPPATPSPVPQFVLVRSTNPHREGQYGQRGLRFTRAWRLLKVDPELQHVAKLKLVNGHDDVTSYCDPQEALDNDTISLATLAVLEADSYLAVKPATQADGEKWIADQAANGGDTDAQNEALRAKNAELEARLMKLELAAQGGGKATKGDAPKGDAK